MAASKEIAGPDLALGIALAEIPLGSTLVGRVADQAVLLTRRVDGFFAVSASCTHYGAPLGEGRIDGDQVRCPWHHACFSLRSGEALSAPAFDALTRWNVEVIDERVFVRDVIESAVQPSSQRAGRRELNRVVVVGGGAAGFAAAEMLRRRGFSGDVTMLSADAAAPCDRPNLSKDYLAGTAPEEWIPLKDAGFYTSKNIDLRLGAEVKSIDTRAKELTAASGETFRYDALLLATGATAIRLPGQGFDLPNVYVLRTLADARALIEAAEKARRVAVVGASFIGLEVAASLRTRGLDVQVIAPDQTPLQRVLGQDIGRFIQRVHEEQGVQFHLGRTAESFDGQHLHLNDGGAISADFVVLGVGVRPNIQLAAAAGLAIDNGIVVDANMRTDAPGVFAAGDVARYPDQRLGQRIRVEHWVAAEQQGQAAAESMLGETAPFAAIPFFWSHHYDRSIRYVGHATQWTRIEVDGCIESGDFTARYLEGDCLLAAASLGRDGENLDLHAAMDRAAAAVF
ncbi:MAG TPA: FAD-dependent oxidoreductase [Candidatus Binatia bacterium]|nr:FAD-dependent oxidoreductase [Candidatus Binatia bacterium]